MAAGGFMDSGYPARGCSVAGRAAASPVSEHTPNGGAVDGVTATAPPEAVLP